MGSGKKSYDINAVYCRLRIGFDHPVSETTSTQCVIFSKSFKYCLT